MQIWIVWHTDVTGKHEIVRIYDSEEKATAYVSKHNQPETLFIDTEWVE